MIFLRIVLNLLLAISSTSKHVTFDIVDDEDIEPLPREVYSILGRVHNQRDYDKVKYMQQVIRALNKADKQNMLLQHNPSFIQAREEIKEHYSILLRNLKKYNNFISAFVEEAKEEISNRERYALRAVEDAEHIRSAFAASLMHG